MAPNLVVTASLVVAMTASILFNICFLIVYFKRKRMRKMPTNLFLVCLAVTDLLATFLWTIFTVLTSTSGEWLYGDFVCQVQAYFFGFCSLMNALILFILMCERIIKVFKPSRHAKIFFYEVVVLAIGMSLIFSAVLASFPIIGWGKIEFMDSQYQCNINYIFHDSQLDFSFFWQFAFPVLTIIVCYVAILVRIKLLRKNLSKGEAIILEEKDCSVAGDAYADRLKKQRTNFEYARNKNRNPKIRSNNSNNDDGYKSSSDELSTSDEDESGYTSDASVKSDTSRFSEIFNTDTESNKKKKKMRSKKGPASSTRDKKRGEQRIYYMTKEDMIATHMYAAMSAAYFGTWFLYYIMSYTYTHELGSKITSDFVIIAVCLSHFGSCVKSPFYLMSGRYRRLLLKTLTCGRSKNATTKGTTGAKPDDTNPGDSETGKIVMGEMTTEL